MEFILAIADKVSIGNETSRRYEGLHRICQTCRAACEQGHPPACSKLESLDRDIPGSQCRWSDLEVLKES